MLWYPAAANSSMPRRVGTLKDFQQLKWHCEDFFNFFHSETIFYNGEITFFVFMNENENHSEIKL